MDASHFVVDDQVKIQFAGLYLLYAIEKEAFQFSEILRPDERVLLPIFSWLRGQDYIRIDHTGYVPTSKGQAVLNSFLDRYQLFLSEFDIYCGVDLEQREFAFRYYDKYSDLEEWQEFLAEDRWEDLRIAIAEYKGLDPVEIVFMSLIHEGRFGRDEEGWNGDLLLGSIWDEIQSICNTAVRLKSLHREVADTTQNPEAVLMDIIQQGKDLITELGR